MRARPQKISGGETMKTMAALAVITILFTSAPVAFAGHRIQDEAESGPDKVRLRRTRIAAPQARGQIVFSMSDLDSETARLKMKVRIRDLESDGGKTYQVWLIDSFKDADLPLKRFRADANGDADFTSRARVEDVTHYDKVTVNESNDSGRDSLKRGRTVLTGEPLFSGD